MFHWRNWVIERFFFFHFWSFPKEKHEFSCWNHAPNSGHVLSCSPAILWYRDISVRSLSPFVTFFNEKIYPHLHLDGFLEHNMCVNWELCVAGWGSDNLWTKQCQWPSGESRAWRWGAGLHWHLSVEWVGLGSSLETQKGAHLKDIWYNRHRDKPKYNHRDSSC